MSSEKEGVGATRVGESLGLLQALLEDLVERVAKRIAELVARRLLEAREGHIEPEADLMDVAGAAEYLNLSNSTVYKLASSGRLASVKLGRRLMFRRTDLDAYIAEHRRDGQQVVELATAARAEQKWRRR